MQRPPRPAAGGGVQRRPVGRAQVDRLDQLGLVRHAGIITSAWRLMTRVRREVEPVRAEAAAPWWTGQRLELRHTDSGIALAPDAVVIAVEAVVVRRDHDEVGGVDAPAIQVAGVRGDADTWVRGIAAGGADEFDGRSTTGGLAMVVGVGGVGRRQDCRCRRPRRAGADWRGLTSCRSIGESSQGQARRLQRRTRRLQPDMPTPRVEQREPGTHHLGIGARRHRLRRRAFRAREVGSRGALLHVVGTLGVRGGNADRSARGRCSVGRSTA